MKIFFLHDRAVIGYANNSAHAHGILHEIAKDLPNSSVREIVAYLAQAQNSKRVDADFLLADTEQGCSRIHRLVDGTVHEVSSEHAWIGDREAASALSKALDRGEPHPFQTILMDPKFPGVGGFQISLAARGGSSFRYDNRFALTSPIQRPNLTGDWNTVDFGSAETGGYGYTSIVPVDPGINSCGIYIFQTGFGFFFHVNLKTNTFERIEGHTRTANGFRMALEKELGLQLQEPPQLH